MFDLKKTIILAMLIVTLVAVAISGFIVGRLVGYSEGAHVRMSEEHGRIIKADSLLRKQTELCHKLIDMHYSNNNNSQ